MTSLPEIRGKRKNPQAETSPKEKTEAGNVQATLESLDLETARAAEISTSDENIQGVPSEAKKVEIAAEEAKKLIADKRRASLAKARAAKAAKAKNEGTNVTKESLDEVKQLLEEFRGSFKQEVDQYLASLKDFSVRSAAEVSDRSLAQPTPSSYRPLPSYSKATVELPVVPSPPERYPSEEPAEQPSGARWADANEVAQLREQLRELQNLNRRRPSPPELGFQNVDERDAKKPRRKTNYFFSGESTDDGILF